MKKFKNLLFVLVLGIFIFPNIVNAASATLSVKTSSQATVGSTITATISLSSSSAMGSWQYIINYDSSKLKLLSGDTSVADYTTSVSGVKSKSYTLKFKALSSGSASINIGSYLVYSIDEDKMSVNVKNANVKIITKSELEASYSDDATLKSLDVSGYELNFDSKTYEYSLEVPNDVLSVKVNASKNNANASVNGGGEITLNEGINKVEIVVTAQKGNTLTYTININRKELDPITVTFDNKSYTIVRKSAELGELTNFSLTEIDYEENKIPALYNESSNITLIGLKDENGNIKTFIYENGIKALYEEIKSSSMTIIPESLKKDNMFSDYEKTEIEYNDMNLEVYKFKGKTKQIIIYGLNIETGKRNYYVIDLEENSISLYRNDIESFYKNEINKYKYVIYGLSGAIVALLLILIFTKIKRKRKKSQ